jgi:hypothetical protein
LCVEAVACRKAAESGAVAADICAKAHRATQQKCVGRRALTKGCLIISPGFGFFEGRLALLLFLFLLAV